MRTLLCIGLLAATAALAADGPAKAPLALAPGPHLFLDDHLIERAENVTRRVQQPVRDLKAPVVTGPEDKNFQPYVTVLRDPQTRRFRMWYNANRGSDAGVGHMESADGIRWERPHRDLEPPAGAPFKYGAGVVDDGPGAPDPANRYKLAWWMHGGMVIAGSPDGFRWTLLRPEAVIPHNHDINSLHKDPATGQYVAFVSTYITGPAWKGQRRCTMQSVSRDAVSWEKPWLIFTPDDSKDPGETQFYCMSGMLRRGGLLIGTLKVLRDDLPADPGGQTAGIGYTVLAWSRDGRTWTRDREPFLDRHPDKDAWDHAHTWIDCQLPVGDEVFLYYGGYQRGHKIERFKERQIGLVRIKRDRYVAREAGPAGGTLRTPLAVLGGTRLTVNADAKGGELRAQLTGEDGRPVPGFSYADCRPVTTDALEAPLRWKRGLDRVKGKPVRLEFRLRGARLYGFDVGA